MTTHELQSHIYQKICRSGCWKTSVETSVCQGKTRLWEVTHTYYETMGFRIIKKKETNFTGIIYDQELHM